MDAKSVDVHTASHIHFVENWSARLSNLGLLKRPFSMTKGGYMITMKGGKVKEVFGSKAKEKRFKQEALFALNITECGAISTRPRPCSERVLTSDRLSWPF
jgi:hypothetical protein